MKTDLPIMSQFRLERTGDRRSQRRGAGRLDRTGHGTGLPEPEGFDVLAARFLRVGRNYEVLGGRAAEPWVRSRQQLPRSAGAVMAPVDGRSLVFRGRKADRHGVSVQATGTVPLFARRPDGSTLVASGTPLPAPLPDWLLVELGGRWGKPRAA